MSDAGVTLCVALQPTVPSPRVLPPLSLSLLFLFDLYTTSSLRSEVFSPFIVAPEAFSTTSFLCYSLRITCVPVVDQSIHHLFFHFSLSDVRPDK